MKKEQLQWQNMKLIGTPDGPSYALRALRRHNEWGFYGETLKWSVSKYNTIRDCFGNFKKYEFYDVVEYDSKIQACAVYFSILAEAWAKKYSEEECEDQK